jgi:predicted component of type VI protein secretion system
VGFGLPLMYNKEKRTMTVKSRYLEEKMQKEGSVVTYGTVDISATYDEDEVQAISTALTSLIATLKAQGVIKSS